MRNRRDISASILLILVGMAVSVKEKSWLMIMTSMGQGDVQQLTTDEVSKR